MAAMFAIFTRLDTEFDGGFLGWLRGGTAALQHRAHRRLPSDAV
jgi:hypothetical protein